jgi:signal transduction histidine kinase
VAEALAKPAAPAEAAAAAPAPVAPLAGKSDKSTPSQQRQPEQQSQFVVTSRLLSQIASQGDFGLIPRFVGDRLVFLFWERQKDGRIAGCQIDEAAFRRRIAEVLPSTASPVRILTILDERGAPLAVPPEGAARDWRRPFVAREIGELLPRWEAASYLASADVLSAPARFSSLVMWIMVGILIVSVAGGGTMVLASVSSEMRLAQKKATFVTNVSHELKTPLTAISLFIELLQQKRRPPAAKRERYLSLMASETERLTRLINNVLDFSSMERGSKRYAKEPIDAAAEVREIAESQRVRLESKGFSLIVKAEKADGRINGDPQALKQLVLNLLSNAEKYSPSTKEIEVLVESGADGVCIHVSDRGIGVPEKERERIFREFFRVNDSLSSGVQGTGLGLTIARRIARDHGGDIVCAQREGGGSDFIVRLPGGEQ